MAVSNIIEKLAQFRDKYFPQEDKSSILLTPASIIEEPPISKPSIFKWKKDLA